jgi:RimJ/RimL family protein N-acetyltransferase
MLRGRLVDLRAIEPADYPLLARWYNRPDVMTYWGLPGNTVSVAEVARKEEAETFRGNSRKYLVQTKDAQPIGFVDYYDLDWQARRGWVSILIGEESYWGGGYGTDAMRTLLRYLFSQLGLHRVSLNVHESNVRAQRSYRKNGFVQEGLMRDWTYFDGRWENGILMSVLADGFADIDAGEP